MSQETLQTDDGNTSLCKGPKKKLAVLSERRTSHTEEGLKVF